MEVNLIKRFGVNVLNKRNELGFTQEKLADLSSLNRTYIADIELGKRNVSLKTIEKLSEALSCSAGDLLK